MKRAIVGVLAVAFGGVALGQEDVEPTVIIADAPVSAVTVYPGRAAATRRVQLDLQAGLYDVRFERLPAAIQSDSLQARSGGEVTILGVDFEQMEVTDSTSPELAALDDEIQRLEREMEDLAGRARVIEKQEAFLDSIALRVADDSREAAGTDRFDPDAIRAQLAFLAEERTTLLDSGTAVTRQAEKTSAELEVLGARRLDIADDAKIARTAIVSAVVPRDAQVTIDLSYLITESTWEPVYRVRAARDGSLVTIDYNALITQRSGEDWNDVTMTLSTAQPMLAANPPVLRPAFVDLIEPARPRAPTAAAARDAIDVAGMEDRRRALEEMAGDARVGGAGPSVTYELRRPVSVQTNVQSRQQTRIAMIQAQPRFIHEAVPQFGDAVYIRARLANNSPYLLLPGRASIFLEQDFVGPTNLDTIPPQGRFEMYFGIDRTVRAQRELVRKVTSKTGLLAGGRETSYEYRIEVENASGKPINLELWDRYPVSRSDQIKIELVDLSLALDNDAEYVNEDLPRGLLKWTLLGVPPTAQGPSARVITYGVKVNRDKNVMMTPLPE